MVLSDVLVQPVRCQHVRSHSVIHLRLSLLGEGRGGEGGITLEALCLSDHGHFRPVATPCVTDPEKLDQHPVRHQTAKKNGGATRGGSCPAEGTRRMRVCRGLERRLDQVCRQAHQVAWRRVGKHGVCEGCQDRLHGMGVHVRGEPQGDRGDKKGRYTLCNSTAGHSRRGGL